MRRKGGREGYVARESFHCLRESPTRKLLTILGGKEGGKGERGKEEEERRNREKSD